MYQSNTRFREWFSKVPQRFWSCTSVHPVNATLKYTFISQEPTQQNKPLGNPNNHHPSMRPPFTHCNRHPSMRSPFTHAAALHPLQPPSINEAALHPWDRPSPMRPPFTHGAALHPWGRPSPMRPPFTTLSLYTGVAFWHRRSFPFNSFWPNWSTVGGAQKTFCIRHHGNLLGVPNALNAWWSYFCWSWRHSVCNLIEPHRILR